MYIGKVNVLGIEYDIRLYRNFKELNEKALARDERYLLVKPDEKDRKPLDGYCDYTYKEINVFIDGYTAKDYFEATVRHELCHAFLYEIGNTNYDNEDLVDQLSRWIPQITSITNSALEVIKNARSTSEN